MVVHSCNPKAEEEEMGESWSLLARQSSAISKDQVKGENPCLKWQGTQCPKEQLWRLTSGLHAGTHECAHTP